jgi:hypothetical protein
MRRKYRALGEVLSRIEAHPEAPVEPVVHPALKIRIDAAAVAIEIAQRAGESVEAQAKAALIAGQPELFGLAVSINNFQQQRLLAARSSVPVGNC